MAFCSEIALTKRKKRKYVEWEQNKAYLFRGSLILLGGCSAHISRPQSIVVVWYAPKGVRPMVQDGKRSAYSHYKL